ncbi:MAG: PEGA domain-containing protein [Deltaproteobacteria bacterium]|nr:PEGA domain-containing protein [Deltaproteobacteria bacterium]
MKKKKHHLKIGLAVATMLLLSVSVGWTQPRDNPLERARHHMELGQEAFAGGSYEEAAEQFTNAFSASPFAAFLYNAGLAYEKAENVEKAVDMYQRYLQAEPEAHDYAQVDMKIRALLAGAETPTEQEVEITEVEMKSLISMRTNPPDAVVRILDKDGTEVSKSDGPAAQTVVRGTYTIEASHPDFRTVQTKVNVTPGQVYIVVVEMSQGAFLGFLHVTTDVPGAAVYVDDKSAGQVGITPWGNVQPAGKHTIWIEKPGYAPIEMEVEVNLGEEVELPLTLKRLDFGTILVKANIPGTEVFLDDKPLGTAPLEEQVSPGRHKLLVKAEGMKDYTTMVEVGRGQRTKTLVRMNPRPSRTSAWVSLGFSVALFAGGGVAGGMALKLNNELDSKRRQGRLSDDDPRIMKGFLWALGADLAFGVGTVVGALCIYYFLRDPLPPSEGRVAEPVDFEENPEGLAGGPNESEKEQPSPPQTEARREPKVFFAPLLSAQAAGFGLAVVF